jgi:hypothetical protein
MVHVPAVEHLHAQMVVPTRDGQHHMTLAVVAVDEVGSATHVTLTSRTREGLGGGGEAEQEKKEFITKGLQQ